MNEDCCLEAVRLGAGYGGIPVVHDLDLGVRPGEVVGLIGANGAGKTTTLMTLAGAIPAIAGEVRFDGVPTTAPLHERARKGFAFVPEQRAIFRRLDVASNLRLGIGSVADALSIAPELETLLGRKAGLLSGGEQQILVLARALAAKPRIVAVDEVSLGLAPLIVERMLELLRSAAAAGAGVLIVEQHLQHLLDVTDRLVVLRRGRAVLSGATSDLRGRVDEIQAAYLPQPVGAAITND